MQIYYNGSIVGGDTSNYSDITNLPKINGVEIKDSKNTEELEITWYGTQAEYDAIVSAGTVNPNTMYIVDDGAGTATGESYLDLLNKPSINGVTLEGNKTSGELDMYTKDEIDERFTSMRSIKVVTSKPLTPLSNTMYYVGPNSEGFYHVYLYDSVTTEIDMGMTDVRIYKGRNGINVDTNNVITLKNDATTVIINSEGKVAIPVMKGATALAAGTAGLVPAPNSVVDSEGGQIFLRGDGQWAAYPTMVGATDTTDGVKGLVPMATSSEGDRYLRGDGTWGMIAGDFKGASATADGEHGLVPEPKAGQENYFLKGDGTWANIFDLVYPVGSIYISYTSTSLPANFAGTWTRIADGYTLWSASSDLGNTIAPGLPNIKGKMSTVLILPSTHAGSYTCSGAITMTGDNNWTASSQHTGRAATEVEFNASTYNPTIYNDANTTVQPPAIKVAMFKRTA